jgi:hypothetical protein
MEEQTNETRTQSSDGDSLKSRATELAQEAKQRGQNQLDTTKKAAADQVQKVADVVEQASAELGRHDQQSFARYTNEFANRIKTLADTLNNRSIDELGTDALNLARKNPTLFLLGSVAIGFALSRFVKASSAGHEKERDAAEQTAMALEPQASSESAMLPPTTVDADVTRYPEVVIPNEIKGE